MVKINTKFFFRPPKPNSIRFLTQWSAARAGLILVTDRLETIFPIPELNLIFRSTSILPIGPANCVTLWNWRELKLFYWPINSAIKVCPPFWANCWATTTTVAFTAQKCPAWKRWSCYRNKTPSQSKKKINRKYSALNDDPFYYFSSSLRWSDLMNRATPALISDVHNLQRRIQFGDPVNIQFTSVLCPSFLPLPFQ